MDGRGRAFDNIFVERFWRNVKHEDVYLKGYATMTELTVDLTEYFDFYNNERPLQSRGHKTPDVVYRTAMGGDAVIVDKYSAAAERLKQKQYRGSAEQLRLKLNVQLKLSVFLS